MLSLFPQAPSMPAKQEPARVWVMPMPVQQRRHYFKTCRALPPGRPDCLLVQARQDEVAAERCVAALYGAHAYVIHYEFVPHKHATTAM